MDKPLDGLRLGASSKTIALADVSVDQLMSGLSDDQKAGLTEKLAPPKAEEPALEPEASEPGKKAAAENKAEPEKGKEEAPKGAAADPGHAQYVHGFQAAVDRNKAVFASEHFEGREKAAARLLGNAKLSADEITATLADLPKGEAGNNMLDGLKGKNPDLAPGAEAGGDASKAEAGAVWDRVAERKGWNK